MPTGQTSTWSESQTRRYDAERKTLRRERATSERSSNAAYIYLKDHAEGEAVRQHHVDEPHTRGMIVLDFDKKGRLIGIEVLDATAALPEDVLRAAERI